MLARVVRERRARHPQLGRDDDQPPAREQTQAQVPEGDVEAGRGELQDPAVRADTEPVTLGGDQFGDAGVGEHHSLGPAGRAGGVDHVRGVEDVQRPVPVGVGGIRRGRACHGRGGRRVVEHQP